MEERRGLVKLWWHLFASLNGMRRGEKAKVLEKA
jgi:hypothetical protein